MEHTITGNTMLAKMDIKSAFRLLPIHPSDFELLGIKLNDKFYFDKCLPMGCSISCALFEKFSCFLEWLVKEKAKSESVLHYLDDFLFAGSEGSNNCQLLMHTFSEMCCELRIPLAEDKTVGPAFVLAFLGIEIDKKEMLIRIPREKLESLRFHLEQVFWCEKG